MKFDDLGLGPEVLKAVDEAGYTEPTPIQEQAIPFVLQGRDVLGCAQTGTGKTASFTLPMIEILATGRAKARMPRSLIITPTRELATQIADNFEVYGKYHKLSMALLIGGVSFENQQAKLDRGVDVLIATPGRLLDHFGRGGLLLNDIKILVIDEADRMMDMGFIPDVEKIVSLLSPMRMTLFFSATMPKEIRRLADKFLSNPKEITVDPATTTAETIKQFMVVVGSQPAEKREALRTLIRAEPVDNAIIFCNRKRDADILARSLKKHDFSAAALHGDMSQPARLETLENFKSGEIKLLVASDVAARGLDIPKVSHVFNFDVPSHAEDYVHRIGRTGRAGREGRALTIATPEDGKFLDAVVQFIGNDIETIEVEGLQTESMGSGRGSSRGRSRGGAKGAKGAKGRGGAKKSRARRSEQTDKPEEQKQVEAKPAEQLAKPEPKPADEKPQTEAVSSHSNAKPEPTNEPKGESVTVSENSTRPSEKSQNDNRRNNQNQKKDKTLGMGEHTPAFLLRPARANEG